MHLRASLCLLPLSAALATLVRADTFHVAPGGSDKTGDGTAEKPWGTVQHACDELSPGDAVILHAGVYPQRVVFNVSGEKGKPVTLMGEPGAVLTGKGAPKGQNIIEIADQSHVRIMGLEIRDTMSTTESHGIHVDGGGDGIEIRQCTLHNLKGKCATAIGIYGTNPKTPLTNIIIDGCTIHDCTPADSEALTLNGNIDGFEVTDNTVRDVNNIGIDFIGGEKDIMKDPKLVARNGVCRGNRVFRARSSYGEGYGAGIYVDGGKDIVIEGNLVSQCDLGIEIGAENPGMVTSGIIVRNNRIWLNSKAGLVFGGYDADRGRVTGCKFQSNVFYKNAGGRGAEAELWIQHATGNEVRGNTFWCAPGSPMAAVVSGATKNTVDANVWFSDAGDGDVSWTWGDNEGSGFAAWRTASGQDKGSVFRKPAFPDPDKGDFGVL